MCGFAGIVNLKENLSFKKDILISMNNNLRKRGPDECGYFTSDNALLGHSRLIVIDPDGGKQPMSFKYNNNIYTIVYNGQIYNTKELKETLLENGFKITTHSDTEILLKSFIHYGYEVVNHLNGIFAFAIWNSSKQDKN